MQKVADIYQQAMATAKQTPPLDLTLSEAVGCVLAQDVIAGEGLPAFAVATCDGYAIRADDLFPGGEDTTLIVTGEVRAGDVDPPAHVRQTAVKIESGAPLPQGADAVAPLVDTDEGSADVVIHGGFTRGANVLAAGSDIPRGAKVVTKGTRLGPPQIAAVAALGRPRVVVHPRPRVVILSVGDGLVEPGAVSRRGTVYDANAVALAAAAAEVGAQTFRTTPIPNDVPALRDMVEDQMMRADVVITTGGLSRGAGSAVREVLRTVGEVRFKDVAAFPGSTIGIGMIPSGDGYTPVFALPGDPVAAQVAFEVYVRPVLRKMMGWKSVNRPSVKAQVSEGFTSPGGVREFVRVRLSGDPRGGYVAEVLAPTDQLLTSALAEANGLAVVPEEVEEVRAGTTLSCILLD